jgi:hypothetical protein
MLKWLFGSKLRKVIESDLLDATSMLVTMKLKLHKEGPDATVSYGEGVKNADEFKNFTAFRDWIVNRLANAAPWSSAFSDSETCLAKKEKFRFSINRTTTYPCDDGPDP